MSELSRVMEKHANPGKWREIHEGWVGKKRYQFPSQLALPYPQKSWIKHNKAEIAIKCSYYFWESIKWSRSTQNHK